MDNYIDMSILESPDIIARNIREWNIPRPDSNYTVVVQCSTYNHVKYIEDALKGFVMQQTTFPWCVLVTDDCSTDGTVEIIKKYAKAYPHIIKPICLGYNHMQNGLSRDPYISPWHNCGKYIAICEGDDYWIDPKKLQKQVDYLDLHPTYGLCYTKSKVWIEGKKCFADYIQGEATDFQTLLLGYNSIPTASVIYRKLMLDSYNKEINPSSKKWRLGDYPLVLYFANKNAVSALDDITSVYRIVNESASHTTNENRLLPYYYSILDIKLFYVQLYKIREKWILDHILNQHFKLMIDKYHSLRYCTKISLLTSDFSVCIYLRFALHFLKFVFKYL